MNIEINWIWTLAQGENGTKIKTIQIERISKNANYNERYYYPNALLEKWNNQSRERQPEIEDIPWYERTENSNNMILSSEAIDDVEYRTHDNSNQ